MHIIILLYSIQIVVSIGIVHATWEAHDDFCDLMVTKGRASAIGLEIVA